MKPRFRRSFGTLFLFFLPTILFALNQNQANNLATYILNESGRTRGMCSVPRCGDGNLAMAFLNKSELIVHACDQNGSNVTATRALAEPTGELGRRIYVEKVQTPNPPYNNNYIDILVITNLTDSDLNNVSLSEIVRTLCPGGNAWVGRAAAEGNGLSSSALQSWIGSQAGATVVSNTHGTWAVITKSKPADMDEWTHRLHGPDNNPASDDRALTFPFITQYRVKPYNINRNGSTIAGGGRLYEVFRYGAGWRYEKYLLRAFNVYNGQQLWERDLDKDGTAHPIGSSFMVATDDHLYMIKQGNVLQLDGATGAEIRTISFDNTKHIKWIARNNDRLFALLGETSVDSIAKPGNHDVQGMFRYGTIIRTYSITSNSMGWSHTENNMIDAREIGISDNKMYFYANRSGLVCLNAQTGALVWEKRDQATVDLLEDEETHAWTNEELSGFICSPYGIYVTTNEDKNLCAFSVVDGSLMWKDTKGPKHKGILNDILFIKNGTDRAIDIKTNTPNSTYANIDCGSGCGPFSISQQGTFGCWGGISHNVAKAEPMTRKAFKSPCDAPPIVTNGLAITPTIACKCNTLHRGTIAKGSAGTLTLDIDAQGTQRLEQGPGYDNITKEVVPEEKDWVTYRANNDRNGSVAVIINSERDSLWHYKPQHPYPSAINSLGQFSYDPEEEPTSPVIVGNRVFWGGSDGYVHCYNGTHQTEAWSYPTGGRIYATPTVADGCVYVGSGDGYVYCIEAHSGRLVWRFRAAPHERRINLYGHLVSPWPVVTGVLVHDGKAFFAAGLEDHGSHVYAVDALKGTILWQNNTTGKNYHPNSRIGFVPAGTMTIVGNNLFIKSHHGRPGIFNVANGSFTTISRDILDDRRTRLGGPTLRGQDIGNVNGKFLIFGGRMLYDDGNAGGRGAYVKNSTYGFKKLGDNNMPTYPQICFNKTSVITPVWDSQNMVMVLDEHLLLEKWDMAKLQHAVDSVRDENPDEKEVRPPNRVPDSYSMTTWRMEDMDINALALLSNGVAVVYSDHGRRDDRKDWNWYVELFDRNSKASIWKQRLPSEPIMQGLAIGRNGQVVIAMRTGEMICYGGDYVSVQSNTSNTSVASVNGSVLRAAAQNGVQAGASSEIRQTVSSLPQDEKVKRKDSQGLICEYWSGVWGEAIVDLLGETYFPHHPTGITNIRTSETAQNWADNYGQRIRGYVIAPKTGKYRFWIAADEQAVLKLSIDEDPAKAQSIANVTSATSPKDWDAASEQQSTSIHLEAGKRYYIEVLHKEGSGNDHCAVAWKIPEGEREVIDTEYLRTGL